MEGNSVIILDSSDDENGTSKSSISGSVDLTKDTPIRRRRRRIRNSAEHVGKTNTSMDNKHINRKIESGELSFVPVQTLQQDKEVGSLKRVAPATITPIHGGRPVKRIKPTKISDEVSVTTKANIDIDDDDDFIAEPALGITTNTDEATNIEAVLSAELLVAKAEGTNASQAEDERIPITEAFATLLDACRSADSSDDMEMLIKKKLTRYYHTVHPDFVNSKSFKKTALNVAADINANPSLVYLKLTGILEELNIRRKSGQTVVSNEDVASTGNAKKDYQIKRLNKALYVLKKKIALLDEAEVDLANEENSTFLLGERFKKRACEIYEKICDITGESKHAHRLVRKPIVFQGTSYPQFNRAIQMFVNKSRVFPDLFDVLRCLEHCNTLHEFRLSKEEVKRIAQDAFIKIGKSLQKRRKTDLYETVSYFTGTDKDPAQADNQLQTKLIENQKYHLRINEIIDKYAAEQEKTGTNVAAKKSSTPAIDGSVPGSVCPVSPVAGENTKEQHSTTDENENNNKENEATNGNVYSEEEDGLVNEEADVVDDDDADDVDDEDDDDDDDESEADTGSQSTSHAAIPFLDDEIVLSDDDDEELKLS